MRHFGKAVLIAVSAAALAAALGVNAQQDSNNKHNGPRGTISPVSATEVKAALTHSGMTDMLEVPVNRHNIIGSMPKPVKNPYGSSHKAWVKGKTLYKALNCAVCHGLKGGGGQGEQLNTGLYRYGGAPADLYLSIAHGRPAGMPSWGSALSPQAIWYLVTYVKTLPRYHPTNPSVAPAGLKQPKLMAPVIRTFAMPSKSDQGSGEQ